MSQIITEGFPLSPQQKCLWDFQGDREYRIAQTSVSIDGPVDLERLTAALRRIVDRHEILRTTFQRSPGMKVPFQVVNASASGRFSEGFTLTEFRQPGPANRPEHAAEILVSAGQVAPSQLPVLSARLVTFADDQRLLVLTAPALCVDRAAMKNIVSELIRLYARPELELEEPLQYADYSEWQSQLFQESDEAAIAAKAFWERRDYSAIPPLKLPFQREPTADTPAGATVRVPLPENLASLLEGVGLEWTDSAMAAWQILLWRLSGQTEITVSRVSNSRNRDEFSSAVGLFEKAIPAYADFSGDLTFRDVVASVKLSEADCALHEDYFPVEHRPASVGFCPEDDPWSETVSGVTFRVNGLWADIHDFNLALHSCLENGRAKARITFATELFPANVAERMAARLGLLLAAAAGSPDSPAHALPIMDEEEKRDLLITFNQTSADYPRGECIHYLFEAQARRTPDRLALRCGGRDFTYTDLNIRANRLAHYLRSRGVKANTCVGLFVERSAEMIVGLLAILKAGGCYVPLVPDHPRARLAHQLSETAAPVILTQERLVGALPEFIGDVICIDRADALLASQPETDPKHETLPEDLVYVIYTSGSTGVPKGVAVRHRGLVNYSHFMCRRLGLEGHPEGLQFATVSTIAADLGNTAIFPSLISGGCLHVIDYETAMSPDRFSAYVAATPVDILKITPTHLTALLDGSGGGAILPRTHLVTGGEALRWELLDRIGRSSGCKVINHYGPTEATVGCCTFVPEQSGALETVSATVPIGRPISNTQIYILDSFLQPVPVGVAAELCIAGDGVAEGYLNQPRQTEERFVQLPWQGAELRAYRTGDLARFLPGGDIEFLGRIDQQVKIRGFRVEPAEIVSALKAHPLVKDAVVIPDNDSAGERRLIACLVAAKTLKEADLRTFLRQDLPDYMIPAGFVMVDAIPFTANGKVDATAISLLLKAKGDTTREMVEPRTPEEARLAEMWTEVLRIDRVGVTDNFFDLGGHSLMATQVISRVRSMFRVQLPLIAFLETPTIAELAIKLASCPPLEDDGELARLLQELEGISEEEAEALLAAETENNFSHD